MKVALGLFVLLTAVQTYAAMSIDTLKAKLDGRWEWVSTCGGYAGETYTPENVRYSLMLIFSKNDPQPASDSIGYRVYSNDTLLFSGYTTLSSSAVQIRPFGPGNNIAGALVYKTDSLLLETFISDGYSSTFVRPATSLKRDRPRTLTMVQNSPSGYPLEQFTLSGRRMNTGRCSVLPAQISVSRQHAVVEGIDKR